ncbi:MAG: uracil-DNA glycosylase [Christensenellaceae bacterium]|nr:uracil-DNA glycosylase [Christensenellaceae bacterium]
MIEKLDALYKQMIEKSAEKYSNKVVVGEGLVDKPKLMLIGEAPGAQEEREGKPFVGKAGKNLTELLNSISIRREDIFISNVVKIRPSKVSKAGNIVNRPPNNEEKAFFIPWLYREVRLIKPQGIVTLGNVALSAFLGNAATIGDFHGKWHNIKVNFNGEIIDIRLFPLYHPAAIIYNRALIYTYNEDLAVLAKSLQ